MIKICEQCGKPFKCKPSSNRRFCSRECSTEAHRGVPNPKNAKEKVRVQCAVCGKVEYVLPSRAKNYVCCSRECSSKLASKRYTNRISVNCEVCGKPINMKPSQYERAEHHCCSVECSNELKKTTYSGEGNPQFGLLGPLNASFKNSDLLRKNGHLDEVFVYSPDTPGANKGGRITLHRKLITDNKHLFDPIFFDESGKLLSTIQVHHIDTNHNNNSLDNLIPLTKPQHATVHNLLNSLYKDTLDKIIGVYKDSKLLENDKNHDQQSIYIDSETILASASTINQILEDYIVQIRMIAINAYNDSIGELKRNKKESESSDTSSESDDENQQN